MGHILDVQRALRFDIECTKDTQKAEALFVKFQGSFKGHRASTSLLSTWFQAAYRAITAHSIGWAATSTLFDGVG